VCSHAFDPVGDYRRLGDMPNDGCGVGQLFDLRAQIEDEGNHGLGSKGSPIALVDPASVVAYVLDDTSQVLVVDTDGDGICDDVNPQLQPTTTPTAQSHQVLAVRMVGMPPKGKRDFTPDPTPDASCPSGKDKLPPEVVCGADGSLRSFIHYVGPSEPAIWTVEPFSAAFCTGAQLDVHPNDITDGWACIAVVAADRVGNRSVSAPLRVFVDRKGTQIVARGAGLCPAPPASDRTPPDCTGSYDRATKQVSALPCRARRIAAPSIRAEMP
jgi:hypothetical protein